MDFATCKAVNWSLLGSTASMITLDAGTQGSIWWELQGSWSPRHQSGEDFGSDWSLGWFLGLWLPRSRHTILPWMQASDATMLAEKGGAKSRKNKTPLLACIAQAIVSCCGAFWFLRLVHSGHKKCAWKFPLLHTGNLWAIELPSDLCKAGGTVCFRKAQHQLFSFRYTVQK